MANDVTLTKTYANGKVDIMTATEMNALYSKLNDRVYVTNEAGMPATGEYAGQIYFVTDANPSIRCRIWFADGWYAIPIMQIF